MPRSATLSVFVVLALSVGFAAGRRMTPPGDSSVTEAREVTAAVADTSPVTWVARPSQGPDDARVSVVEYTDYQCPFCRRYHEETFGKVLDEYGDRIRYVVRHFPLDNVHSLARGAARGAVCAQRQGRFWAYHDALLGGGVAGLTEDALIGHAGALGLDVASFRACLRSETSDDVVSGDFVDGINHGVRTTPSFLVNGRLLIGGQTLRTFRSVLDSALAAAGGP